MDLPVSNLKRDEYYTFIHGLAIACIWIIYLKRTAIVNSIDSVVSLEFIAAWLFSTAFLWIVYNFISLLVRYYINKQLNKKTDEELSHDLKVSKMSLFYTGPIEERQINAHILGLLITALIISYYPILSFFPNNVAINLLLHVFYMLCTIFALYKYKRDIYDLGSINRLITANFCDVLNEKTYAQKRAEYFAELKHNEYKNKLG